MTSTSIIMWRTGDITGVNATDQRNFHYTRSIILLEASLERPQRTIPYSSIGRTMTQYSALSGTIK